MWSGLLALATIVHLHAQKASHFDLRSKTKVKVKENQVETTTSASPVKRKPKAPPKAKSSTSRESQTSPLSQESKSSSPKESSGPVRFFGSVEYMLRTDLADSVKPRLYTHSLSLGSGFEYKPASLTIGLGIDFEYESAGERRSEVLVDAERNELIFRDVRLSVEKRFDFEPWTLGLGLANEFPTSPEADREGYRSVTTFRVSAGRAFFDKRLSITPSLLGYYIWNQHRYSPAFNTLNKQNGWRATLFSKLYLYDKFFMTLATGSQVSTYLDGSSDLTYRTNVALGYDWTNVSAYMGLSNGTYVDDNEATLWFIDEYRRVLTFAVNYRF